MKNFHSLITVLCLSITHTTNWGMLTTGKPADQKKVSPIVIKAKENFFMNSLGKQTLFETGNSFLALPKTVQEKVTDRLTDDQKPWVHLGICTVNCKGPDFYILTEICNGNTKMARQWYKLPIEQVLRYYAAAKENMVDYPIIYNNNSLEVQHYMSLTRSQAHIISNVIESRFIYNVEINEFMVALNRIKNIDPDIIGNLDEITDLIRLYPSLKQRAQILCNHPTPVHYFFAMSTIGVLVATIAEENNLYDIIKSFFSIRTGTRKGKAYLAGFFVHLIMNSWYYKSHLNNNVLLQQPTLTRFLEASR